MNDYPISPVVVALERVIARSDYKGRLLWASILGDTCSGWIKGFHGTYNFYSDTKLFKLRVINKEWKYFVEPTEEKIEEVINSVKHDDDLPF